MHVHELFKNLFEGHSYRETETETERKKERVKEVNSWDSNWAHRGCKSPRWGLNPPRHNAALQGLLKDLSYTWISTFSCTNINLPLIPCSMYVLEYLVFTHTHTRTETYLFTDVYVPTSGSAWHSLILVDALHMVALQMRSHRGFSGTEVNT